MRIIRGEYNEIPVVELAFDDGEPIAMLSMKEALKLAYDILVEDRELAMEDMSND